MRQKGRFFYAFSAGGEPLQNCNLSFFSILELQEVCKTVNGFSQMETGIRYTPSADGGMT